MRFHLFAILAAYCTYHTAFAGTIIEWGDSTHGGSRPGPTNPPPNLTNAVALACGYFHSLALTEDGKVVSWGNSSFGQTNVPPDLTNVVGIAAGPMHSAALTADGRVRAWGYNAFEQTTVPTDLTNVVQIAAGESFTAALLADGSVRAWGIFNTFVPNTPIFVPPTATNCIAISASAGNIVAITNGGVMSWGQGSSLTNPPSGLTNVVAVTCGRDAVLALRADGTLAVWGIGEFYFTNHPAMLQSNVMAVSMERLWGMTLNRDGQVFAWGNTSVFDYGQTNVPPWLTNVILIAAGRYFGLALSDPSDSLSWALPPLTVETSRADLAVPTRRGRYYVVESSEDLSTGVWNIERRFAGDGSVQRVIFPAATNRFVRARQLP